MSEGKTHILVVENEQPHAKLIERAFLSGTNPPTVKLVANLRQARTFLTKSVPDLVITALILPDGKGTELIPSGREGPQYPVLIMTAYGNENVAVEVMKAGAMDYVVKSDAALSDISHVAERALREWEHIAKQREAEKALRKSESEKQLILSTLSEQITYQDRNLRIVWANRAAGEAAGRPTNQMVGHYCYEVWHGRREPCVGCPMAKSIETGEPQEGEITTPDGRIWFIRANLVRDEAGEVMGVVETTLDITQRKRAEEALRESRDYLEKLTNSMWDAVFSVKMPERVIEWANDSFELIGYEPEECIGRTTEFLYPDRSEFLDFGNKLASAIVAGKDILHTEQLLKRKNGEVFPAEITITVYKEKGGVVSVTSIVRDITQRKQAEEALQKSEERFRQVVENAEELVWEVDANGLYTYASPIVEKILGFKPEDIVGKKHFYDLFVPEDKEELQKAAFEVFAKKQSFNKFTNRNVHKNGETVWLSTSGVPILDEKGNLLGYRGADIDITEHKKVERKLIDYQVQLRSLALESLRIEEAERRRLARGLHDNIGQELVLAKMELQSSMESTMGPDAMGILDKVCKLLDKVMQDVHSLTFELSSPLLYEVGLVAAVEQWLAEEIRKKHGIKYKLSANVKSKAFDHELSATVFRVVRELLINVVKHANARNVKVGIKELKGALSVAIEDDGVGFDVAKFAKALRKGKKTQFGLFSAKEQLEFLGGKFRIESVPKKGTKVSMTIPLKR